MRVLPHAPKSFWKGSLIGKAVVLKTTAHVTLAGSSPVPSAKSVEASPNWYGSGLLHRHALRVQVRLLSPPPIIWTCSSAESERDSAKVEDTRSNRVRSANTGVAQLGEALVLETSECGFESLRRYQLIMWVVAQLAEHRTVTAAREGSNPFGPPKLLRRVRQVDKAT